MTHRAHEPLGPRPDVTSDREDQRERSIVRARLFPSATEAETVGKYRLRSRIGAGAFGVVYEAVDDELARSVALKIVRGDELGDGGARERVWAEAQALARVSHPNVVAVYDVGWAGDDLYVAMELVRGQTIDEWIVSTRPRWPQVVAVFAQAAAGLAAAHDAGLVHRDVKPSNIRVGSDGRVRVVDFGIAIAPATAGGATDAGWIVADGAASTSATVRTIGTPAFMSPEQLRGDPVDARADQFGLGAALYATLAGSSAFGAATMSSIAWGDAPAPRRPREVPRAIMPAISRSLELDPCERWPTMAALGRALSRGARPLERWRTAITIGLVVLVAIGAIGVEHALQASEGDERAPAQAAHDPRLFDVRWNAISYPVGHYRGAIDEEIRRSGSSSGRIESLPGAAGEFGSLVKTSPAEPYRGERVRLTAWVRTRGVVAGAGIWFRVDDRNGIDIAFDNMRGRLLRGDHDWVRVESVLDVPGHGWSLVFGAMVQGAGQLWVDDIELQVVGADTSVTGDVAGLPTEIIDGSFEHTSL